MLFLDDKVQKSLLWTLQNRNSAWKSFKYSVKKSLKSIFLWAFINHCWFSVKQSLVHIQHIYIIQNTSIHHEIVATKKINERKNIDTGYFHSNLAFAFCSVIWTAYNHIILVTKCYTPSNTKWTKIENRARKKLE